MQIMNTDWKSPAVYEGQKVVDDQYVEVTYKPEIEYSKAALYTVVVQETSVGHPDGFIATT